MDDTEIRIRYKKHENYYYDTIFSFSDSEKRICVSDCDGDSYAGDLEQWDYVDYADIPKVNELFKAMYIIDEINLNDEYKEFYSKIENDDVKVLFKYLVAFCENDSGDMEKFKKLLDENNIKNEYSAYRSSGSWGDSD